MASYTERAGSVRVTVRLPGGARQTATFSTRAEAETWAEGLEKKKALGLIRPSAGHAVTVRDLLDAYETIAARTDTGRWNSLRIAKWSADPLAALRLSAVGTHEINDWIIRRSKDQGRGGKDSRIATSTINRELNLLSAAFTYAVKVRKWIEVNPCHGAARPADPEPRGRDLLTADELRALSLSAGYDDDPELRSLQARAYACFLLGLETGMRSGEILRLRPADYDKASRVIRVAALEQGGRKGSKSGLIKSGRNVPLTQRATELLDQLLKVPPDPAYIVGMTDRQRDAIWRKLRNRSGVEDLTFHDSKHEAATRLSKFIDVLALSHAIGTKNVRLLRDTYYNDDAKRSAALLPASLRQD